MTVSYPYDYRYRNMIAPEPPARAGRNLIIALVAGFLVLCCVCFGLAIGIWLAGGFANLPALSSATPTRNPNLPVGLRTPIAGSGGLEATVVAFQRPLKVEGAPKIAANEQFVLVTIRLRNTRTTGTALKATPADFTIIGDGGLTYPANPKLVTIKNLMTEVSVEPGKQTEAEMIFQVATDDSGLKLIWTLAGAKRTILLE